MSSGVTAKADRWFAATNLSYGQWIGNTQLTAKLGYLHGVERYDDSRTPLFRPSGLPPWSPMIDSVPGTASKNTMDQVRLDFQAGYWLNGFLPYVGLAYTEDINRSTSLVGATIDPIGKRAWIWSLGASYFSIQNGITYGLVFNEENGRTNQNSRNLIANISLRF